MDPPTARATNEDLNDQNLSELMLATTLSMSLAEPTVPDTTVISSPPPFPAPKSAVTLETRTKSQATRFEQKLIGIRRFSFRSFSSTPAHGQVHDVKPAITALQQHEKKTHAAIAFSRRIIRYRSSNSDRRALDSALMVRSFIVGPSGASPQLTTSMARPQLSKLKSQLMEPESANKVIAQLRALPLLDKMASERENDEGGHSRKVQGPIHAVCLEYPDAEMHKIHFAPLVETSNDDTPSLTFLGASSISLSKLSAVFDTIKIIDLIKSPDLGLGQPGNGPGLLAGAVPTAETVISGIEQITPQLMALGYATGRAVLPDHTGIYPPTDRMSVLTYWWGLELVLPPPSLTNLAHAQSIVGTVVNLLTALSLMNEGVREILPFVRYIAQFVDFEFNSIKGQNRGKGVVCAATWIMPAAMVPRPWDFPDPPRGTQATKVEQVAVKNPLANKLPSSPLVESSPTVDPTSPVADDIAGVQQPKSPSSDGLRPAMGSNFI